MRAIAYTSEMSVAFDDNQLIELCESAAYKNLKAGVTGYLNFKNNTFFQYLEGPENIINQLYNDIAGDERHRIIKYLDLGTLGKRRFASWHMLNIADKGMAEIRIQDLINDAMTSFASVKSIDRDACRLIKEMIDQLSKLKKDRIVDQQHSLKKPAKLEVQDIPPYVCVLAASAGGLTPLQSLLKSINVDVNVVFIIIQHLSPKTVSLMDTILQKGTTMKVRMASTGMKLAAGSIYLIPPGQNLTVRHGKFILKKQQRIDRVPQFPMDICFRSVAHEYGDRAIAVVLSGTGSDGACGAKVLHEAGGIVIAQSPETAEFDGMPKSCIDTGHVHQILAPAEIAEFMNNLDIDYPNNDSMPCSAQRSEYISEVAKLLRNNVTDFTHYRNETLYRRIERRRVLTGTPTSEEFIALLRSSSSEREELREDILITVTSFFRDANAWDKLAQSIAPNLMAAIDSGETFRVWVTACSTGEEAYTVAIVLTELIEKLERPLKFKIYATDIERTALDRASSGCYSERSLEHISVERLQRFFVRRASDYVVAKKIRENVIFSPHNFVKNAPFTRMDLVTCRNVLIYMQPELQQLAVKMLHFALKVNGILFLGPSETLGRLQCEFFPVQREWNQYKKLRNLSLPLTVSPELSSHGLLDAPTLTPAVVQPLQLKSERQACGLIGLSLDALASHLNTTNVLVDERRTVLLVVSDPSGILRVHTGKPTLDIARMLPKELKTPLTFAFDRAFVKQSAVTHRNLTCNPIGQTERQVDIEVVPHMVSGENEPRHALVVISDSPILNDERNLKPGEVVNETAFNAMRIELAEMKESLQAAINELETSSIQQRSVNEQLSAANEELQSTNEELQSVNEELYTVNFQYQTKIHELSDLNQDLDNLLDSSSLGVIFLDTELCVKRFTDAATQTINLLPSDIGRPFVDLAHNLRYKDLIVDLRRVLSMGRKISREIARNDVDLLQISIHPYRADDGVARGVMIMFSDTKRTTEVIAYEELTDSVP